MHTYMNVSFNQLVIQALLKVYVSLLPRGDVEKHWVT
jgi:hypothetical protein